jgi:phage gp16-like protein
MNRRALLAKVHLAKKELGLDEDLYRLTLRKVTGHESAAECTDGELGRFLDHCRVRGWEPKKHGGKELSKRREIRMLWAIWGELCSIPGAVHTPTRAGLRAFVARQAGVEDPEWLSSDQARNVIEALKAWRDREKRKRPGEEERKP